MPGSAPGLRCAAMGLYLPCLALLLATSCCALPGTSAVGAHRDQPASERAALWYAGEKAGTPQGGSSEDSDAGVGSGGQLLARDADAGVLHKEGHSDAGGDGAVSAAVGGGARRVLAQAVRRQRVAQVLKRKGVKVVKKRRPAPKKKPPPRAPTLAQGSRSPPAPKKQPPPPPIVPKGQKPPPLKPRTPPSPLPKKAPPPLPKKAPLPGPKAPLRPPPKAGPGKSPPPAKVLVHPGDAAALLQVAGLWKSSVDAFQLLGTWAASAPCQDWYGVTCDASGRVTRLNLTGDAQQGSGERVPALFGLSGPLPSQLGALRGLRALGLSNNFLRGSIPGQLGQLESLELLDLSQNLLSGSLPADLGSLGNLTALRLTLNALSGPLPPQLGGLTALQGAFLDSNRLTGGVPPALGALTSLQGLYLQNNALNGSLPRELGFLGSLSELVASNNSLGGSVPGELGLLSSLTRLDLASNNLAGALPLGLALLTRLKELSLSQNGLTQVPLQFSGLVSLSYLSLASNSLAGTFPAALARLRALRHLDASSCEIAGPIPDEISWMVQLTFLSLAGNRLTGGIPSGLSALRGLQSLSLANNLLLGSIPVGFSTLQALEALDLSHCGLTGPIPVGLGSLSSLAFLGLRSNGLTGTLPNEIVQRIPSLELQDNRLSGPLPPALLLTLAFLPSDLGSVSDLGVFLSGNLLSGRCPDYSASCNSDKSQCSALSAAIVGALGGNCLQGCQYKPSFSVPQRTPAACAQACNAGAPAGPCGGQGTCDFPGPNSAPTCRCSAGFFSPPSNPGTCVPTSNATRPPPPPPSGKKPPFAQGVSFATASPLRGLNRWSRYLSAGYRPQAGAVAAWSIPPRSLWLAPGSAFLGYKAPATTNSSGNSSSGVVGGGGRLNWTSVRDQGVCGASWAEAATDAVGAAATLAGSLSAGRVLELSSTQVLSCSAGGKSRKCAGDYPTTAFEYARGTGLALNSSFQAGAACPAPAKAPPPQIVMYEAVQFRGWLGLLLTLQRQPALVVLEAAPSFQNETCADSTLVYQDPGCYTGNLGHTVLVVGYDLSALAPYWVVRNSWGQSWCLGGYMRMGIQGGDGVCGMNLLPAYYPIAAPQPQDPCYIKSAIPEGGTTPALSPCGGGTCKPVPQWGPYGYTCTCPSGFVAVNNTVKVGLPGAGLGVTQACAPLDACGTSSQNPCRVGSCVNDGKGSYSCLCPPGSSEGWYTDGTRTCTPPPGPGAPGKKWGQAPGRLMLRPGVTCCAISSTFQAPIQQLQRQNPGLNCSALVPGRFVNVSSLPVPCAASYTISSPHSTWDEIANVVLKPADGRALGITTEELQILNPTAGCGQLVRGQAVCIKGGVWPGPQVCTQEYRMQAGDTCQSITDGYFPFDPSEFYSLNPGINCGVLEDPGFPNTVGSSGVTVCLGSAPLGTPKCPTGYAPYYTQLGDDCHSLAASRDRFHFKSVGQIELVNRKLTGFRCFGKIPEGSLVCHPVK